MKTIIHKQQNTDVCLSKIGNNEIKGAFFKEKPTIGDIIMSHMVRDKNFIYMFLVTEIKENRDSKIHKDCKKDPKNAYFVLGCKDVTFDKKYSEIDNGIHLINQ